MKKAAAVAEPSTGFHLKVAFDEFTELIHCLCIT